MAWLQLVVVVDAVLADAILGSQEGLSKAMEPDLSDALLSHGHRTMFSSDTNSPYWRLIRKGTAPAFISANIKYAFTSAVQSLESDACMCLLYNPPAPCLFWFPMLQLCCAGWPYVCLVKVSQIDFQSVEVATCTLACWQDGRHAPHPLTAACGMQKWLSGCNQDSDQGHCQHE